MFSTGSRIDKSSGPIRAACSEKWSMEDKDLRTAHAANNDTHMIHAKHTIRSAVPNPYSNVSPGPVSTATIKRKFSGAFVLSSVLNARNRLPSDMLMTNLPAGSGLSDRGNELQSTTVPSGSMTHSSKYSC